MNVTARKAVIELRTKKNEKNEIQRSTIIKYNYNYYCFKLNAFELTKNHTAVHPACV